MQQIVGAMRPQEVVRFPICRRVRLRRATRVYPVGDNRYALGVDQSMSQNIILRRYAVAGDSSGFLEASQGVPGHCAKSARSFFLGRLQHATEGIQIVAGHYRPVRR